MSHTPGPWKIEKTSRFGSPADSRVAMSVRAEAWSSSDQMGDYRGVLICSFEEAHGERFHAFEECDANARLIVTAPELLEFAKRQHHATVCVCHLNRIAASLGAGIPCTHCEAEVLIAKAEGRS